MGRLHLNSVPGTVRPRQGCPCGRPSVGLDCACRFLGTLARRALLTAAYRHDWGTPVPPGDRRKRNGEEAR